MGDVPYYVEKLRSYLPNAELIQIDSPRPFFRNELDVDALVYSAEAGAAWSLVYPEFTVAIPQPDLIRLPTAYALARGDLEWRNLVNTWIELKQKDGTIDHLHAYWIEGKAARQQGPRWSVIRDVLHWID